MIKPKFKSPHSDVANYCTWTEWRVLFKLKNPGFKPDWYQRHIDDGAECYWFVQRDDTLALGIRLSDEDADYISA